MAQRAIELAGDGSRLEVVFSQDEIAARLSALAREIADLSLGNLIVVAVLKGSFVFAADLIRALHAVRVTPEVDFITLSSYRRSTISSGTVDILRDIELDVTDRHVLLVDDVLDSGRTLAYAKDLLSARGARSIRTCVLLDKQVTRAVQLEADLKAFACPDMFVVGYGMDIAHRFRELPFVGRLVTQ
ncbi:MAG: hypoxanthine phosphoribosyltransferase [Hyphomicrobiaceae bacterium]|nr:hypoxanthine phosphoribosyltransferase [Hyphomicrobiaceae bacterium]